MLIDDFIDIIPEASIVAASQHLQPHLIKKKGTIFLNEHSENPEYLANYVFFDKTNNKLGLNSPAFIQESTCTSKLAQPYRLRLIGSAAVASVYRSCCF